jgi:LysM repeat protein
MKLALVGALVVAVAGAAEGAAWSAPRLHKRVAAAHASRAPARGTVVVHAGEGWYQIAKAHGVTMQQLLAANHATPATKLDAGQVLRLPAGAHATAHAKR